MGSTKPAKRLKFAEQANVKNPSEARAMSPHAWGGVLGLPSDRKLDPRNTKDRLEIKDSKIIKL